MHLVDVDLIIYDCDGTLVDTSKHHAQSWYDALLHPLINVTQFSVQDILDHTAALTCEAGFAALQKLNAKLATVRFGSFMTLLDDAYIALVNSQPIHTLRVKGAYEFLEACAEYGFTQFINTNGKRNHVDAAIVKADLKRFFKPENIIHSDDVANGKPAPDMLIEAMRRTGVSAKRTVMFGDTMADANAAKAAGVRFYGIIGVFHGSDAAKQTMIYNMKAAGAIYVFDDYVQARQALMPTSRTGPKSHQSPIPQSTPT